MLFFSCLHGGLLVVNDACTGQRVNRLLSNTLAGDKPVGVLVFQCVPGGERFGFDCLPGPVPADEQAVTGRLPRPSQQQVDGLVKVRTRSRKRGTTGTEEQPGQLQAAD